MQFSITTRIVAKANSRDYHDSVAGYQIIYRSCGVDNVCPVNSGETVLQDCACLNEFAYAVSHMQVLDEASRDMICAP